MSNDDRNIGDRYPDGMSSDALRATQWRKLQKVLHFAYDRVPFYRERFRAIGAEPGDIGTPEDFRAFPLLTRQDILDHVDEMLAYPKEKLVRGQSGGSTGHLLLIYHSRLYERRRVDQKIMLDGWIGARLLFPAFELWGTSKPSNVPARLTRWRLMLQPHYRYSLDQLNPALLEKIAQDFLAIEPRKVSGYASLLKYFALYLLERGFEARVKTKAVISSSETLSDEDRRLMERVYAGPVYNRYNSRENAAIASECRERTGLHVHADHVYLEILRDGRPALAGEPGNVVLTDLDNLAMPFIRYRNEDISAWAEALCPCGRPLPLLETVYGRETSFVFDANGNVYPSINLPDREIRENFGNGRVRQYQYHQAAQGCLELKAVRGDSWLEEDEQRLVRLLTDFFKGAMSISVSWVETILAQPSGKTPLVDSTVLFSSSDENRQQPPYPT